MRYSITQDYISQGNARPGTAIDPIQFVVAHDTGNAGSTAYGNRNYFNNTQPSASAHTFIDDRVILEIIPLTEKAFHVRYNVSVDNSRYGADANDAAIGVELCWGGSINFDEAYDRYVWYHAYLMDRYNFNPREKIIGHSTLDPARRTDPENALNRYGISFQQFITDVEEMLASEFGEGASSEEAPTRVSPERPVVQGVSTTRPLIQRGASGDYVRDIQRDLIRAGFPLPAFGADGDFGGETERAVLRFQRRYGLQVDGIVGPETLAKLKEVTNTPSRMQEFPLPTGVVRPGTRGDNVRQIQRALGQVGESPGAVDGIYGPQTTSAVRSFQSRFNALARDGIYGPNTRRYLEMELEDM